MAGWKWGSLKGAVKTKAFWLHYGLALAQTLVVAAYFLPWRGYHSTYYHHPLIEWLYPRLMDGQSEGVALFVCFVAAVTSLLLFMFTVVKKGEHVAALRVSSMLNSLALVGPLLYIHLVLPADGSGWRDLMSAIDEMAAGWFLALFASSIAGLLALYIYLEACRSRERDHDSNLLLRAKSPKTTLILASFLIISIGGIVAIVGFFLSWNGGVISSLWFNHSWSNYGFEVSVLMYLALIGVVLCFVLLILSFFVRQTMSLAFLQTAENFLIVGLALTLSWGLVLGNLSVFIPDYYLNAELQPGWYLCVIGQSTMLVFMLLVHRVWFTALNNDMALPSKNSSEPTS